MSIESKGVPRLHFYQKLFIVAILLLLLSSIKLLLIVGAILLVIFIVNKIRKGIILRSKTARTHEISPPDDLRPIELGTLYDHKTSTDELVSILFYLVYAGHLEIVVNTAKEGFTSGSYRLTLQDKDQTGLREYERTFLKGIFGTEKKAQWRDFRTSIESNKYFSIVSFQVMQELQRRGYYFFSKEYVHQTYDQALTQVQEQFAQNIFGGIRNLGFGVSQYCVAKGKQLLPRILGFRNYLEIAEKARTEFHTDPHNNILYVSEFAPYTIALGVNTTWGDELLGAEFVPANQVEEI